MRSLAYAALLATLGVGGCASQKQFEENPPFAVTDPTVQRVAAGREEGGVLTELSFRFTAEDPQKIEPDTIYFRGRAMKPVLNDTETGVVMSARFAEVGLIKPDLTMHADSLLEVGNQPPAPLPDTRPFPFELKRDEAVLSYRLKAEPGKRYYRISGIVEKPARILPGRPH